MKIDDLNPIPIKRVLFRFSSHKLVPNESGCYILTTPDGDVLYVGKAINFNQRFKDHLNDSEKTNLTENGKAYWFYYLGYNSKNLERLERSWLNQYENIHGEFPILNKISSPIS